MHDHSFRRSAGCVLAVLALWAVRPSSVNAANVVLSDNITGVSNGGTEAATGASWLASSFGTGNATYKLDTVTLLLENSVAGAAVVDIYSNGGLQPGSLVGTLISPTSYIGPLVETTFTASDITLSANSTYWVVLRAAQGEFDWGWASSDSGAGVGFQDTWSSSSDGGSSWFTYVGPDSYPLQMIVTATVVPEPGSITLLGAGAGLLLLGLRHLRQRTSTHPAAPHST